MFTSCFSQLIIDWLNYCLLVALAHIPCSFTSPNSDIPPGPMYPSTPIYPSTPHPTQQTSFMPMPPFTRASCQSENFTITKHNTHYTKRQLISHQNQHQHQHQHTPTPTNKIKPKSQIQGKILIKLKFKPITVQKN